MANAVESLNALAACRGDGRLRPEAPSRIGPNGDAAACQESMLCNVGRAARDYLPMAKPDVEFPEGALAEVLRIKNVYDLDDDSPAAHYDPDKLKVLKGNTRPRDAKPLVGPEARRFLEFADELIALGDDELREASDPIQPHWDPTLARSIASKRAFIDSLRKVGLITFRRRARCHIGAFFVRKKHDQIRLVLDARPVNQLHRPAPKSRLATPGALANLNLSDEWAAISARALRATQGQVGFESGDAVGDFDVHTASVDLQDGYYQFEVAELSSWFSLGVTYTAMEAGVQEVWSDENRTMEPVDGSEHLWACFAGLPMGWSWALYFCHSACQSACERALARCGLPAVSLGDWTPAPFLATHSAVVAPYVDNANVVAGSKSVATKVLDAVKLELELLGLAVHDEMVPTQDMEMVGRRFDGKRRMLLPRWRRMWRLWFALSEVLRLRVLAPSQMRRLIGHLVDHFAARRETLCVLNAAYRFVGDGEGPVRPLDQEVLAELRVARGVLPLCGLRLDRPICPRVYCSDASDKGYALHVTTASPEEAWEAARFRERWRFRETEGEAVGRDRSLVLQGASAQAFACPGYDREFSLWAAARMEEEAQPAGRASPEPDGPASSLPTGRSRPIPRRDPDMVEVVGAVPRLAEAWVQPARWRRLVAGAWRRPGKIHCKEARAALLGLQREAADPASHGAVVLSFGDNLAETLAFDRGRAKDWELLALVRKGSAFQLGADLRWARRYIETKRNPSDADSRIADRGGLAPGQIIVGDAPPKLRRPLPLSAAVAPTWRRNDDEALAAGDLSVALKAPRDDSDAAEASLTTRRRRPRAALPAAPRPPPGRYVLELFRGLHGDVRRRGKQRTADGGPLRARARQDLQRLRRQGQVAHRRVDPPGKDLGALPGNSLHAVDHRQHHGPQGRLGRCGGAAVRLGDGGAAARLRGLRCRRGHREPLVQQALELAAARAAAQALGLSRSPGAHVCSRLRVAQTHVRTHQPARQPPHREALPGPPTTCAATGHHQAPHHGQQVAHPLRVCIPCWYVSRCCPSAWPRRAAHCLAPRA